MTTPIATTESSKHQLVLDFERMANRSFELCMQELMKVDFYAGLLRRLEAGQSIADELPVVANMSPELVKLTVQRLKKQAELAANEAWELPNELKGSFVTTVRSAVTQGELIPQYCVDYVAETKVGQVRVKAKNWRRNVTVEVDGSAEAIKAAYVQMVFAGLQAS
ncbi:hypothetical protein [Limnohabitans sp. INBF002]|uniref:hypothetical protein n=1 Tax=Limnohabitans sp. INBF002 TaxID=2986280 RepID=UPI0023778463|nr:hypothetical protein [Limnohabitans sp. INBF002]BDU53411.1 hypothetical protein LINBF2_16460 [Limnohabitans sp. INBF002]